MIDEVNAGTKTMKAFAEELTAMADETTDETSKAALEEVVKAVESRDFVTGFFDLVPEGDVEKNENGKYEVTLVCTCIDRKHDRCGSASLQYGEKDLGSHRTEERRQGK